MIEKTICQFEEKLPRGIDIVRYYFHFQKMSEKEKISSISNHIEQLYNRAGIPAIHHESIRSKVKRLIASVKSIIETRKSKNATQTEKESTLIRKLNMLFEVTQNENVLSVVKRDFLNDQRTMRQRFLEADLLEVHDQSEPGTSSQIQQHAIQSTSTEIEMEGEEDYWPETMDFDDSPDFVPSDEEKRRKKIKLCEDDIRELSNCGGSYRIIEKVLSIGIKTAGGNPKDFALSKSSLCEQMNSFRSSNKSDILEQISSSDEKVVIHFDSKKFAKINQKHIGQDSRMVAVCHTSTKSVPLGLPILESGTAVSYSNELIGLCDNYNLTQRVIGLICDTVVTNTGELGGVCVLFENDVKAEMLCITCRHHILEVLLSAAFRATLGPVDAPRLTIFEQLKAEWSNLKEHGYRYRPCDEPLLQSFLLRPFYNNTTDILLEQAKNKFVRDDYAELTDLCLKFLGFKTKKSFMVPGAISKSRWMAKAIYCIKTYLFRDELSLDEDFESNLLELSLFVSLIYCKNWNRCMNAINAPVNDLALITEVKRYSDYNETIANAVINAFQNHFWYLGEELVILSLFSENVSFQDKNTMRLKINSREYPPRSDNSLRLKNYADGLKLADLVTERSRFMLSILDVDTSFLEERAETWKHSKSYKNTEKFIEDLIIVVNDPAERALGRATTIIQNQKARSEARFQNMFLSLYN